MKLRASDVAVTLPVNHEITKLLRIEDLSGTFLVILLRYEDVLTTLWVGNGMVMELRAYDVVVTLLLASHEITKLLRIEDLSGTFLVILLRYEDVLTTLWVGNGMVME